MEKKYTEKDHAEILLWMLNNWDEENPCNNCPKAIQRKTDSTMYDMDSEEMCSMCKSFIDIKKHEGYCPCFILGREDAIALTWQKLREKGYVKDEKSEQKTVLTEEQKQDYISSGGVKCPYCESYDITGGAIEVDQGIATQPMKCEACGKRWTDLYDLKEIIEDK